MSNLLMRFPEGKSKALTLSYDDGVEQDKRLVSLMAEHGIKGTFNINSGLYADEGTVYAPGTIHRRMTKKEIDDLYVRNGMEVAVHGYTHPYLDRLPVNKATYEILKDKMSLEEQFSTIIRGMAYPYGSYNDALVDIIRNCGIVYSRTVISTEKFDMPRDWLRLPATCHHNNPRLMELAEEFVSSDYSDKPSQMFYLWGHSYEFEKFDNWNVIEDFIRKISAKQDIWYATNIEVYDYVHAYEELRFSTDMSLCQNPTSTDVWFVFVGKEYKVEAGQTLAL